MQRQAVQRPAGCGTNVCSIPQHVGFLQRHVQSTKPSHQLAGSTVQGQARRGVVLQVQKARGPAPVRAAAAPTAAEEVSVKEERLPGCVVQLTVTVPAALCQAAYSEVLRDYGQKADLPGFRQKKTSTKKGGKKGGGSKTKAMPEQMLINYIGGEEKVKAAAVEQLLLATMPIALAPYKEEAISDSEALISTGDELVAKFGEQGGLTYVCTVQVPPTVEWTGDVKSIDIEVEEFATPEMVAADVERRLQDERKKQGKMQVVADRGLQRGDMAIVDTSLEEVVPEGAPRGEEGDAPPVSFDRKKMQLDTTTADQQYVPGVVANLEGAKVGETREFRVTLADDYEVAALAGKTVAVKVTLRELLGWDLPEMNDSWANSLFPGCSLAKVREIITNSFMEQAQEETKQRVRKSLSAALGGLVTCEVPERLVRDFGELEYQARLMEAHGKRTISFEQMEALATEELLENFINSNRPDLESMVREVAAVEAIFEQQGFIVPEDQVNKEVEDAAAQFKSQGQEYDEKRLRDQVVETLKATQVLDWLQEQATVRIVPPTQRV